MSKVRWPKLKELYGIRVDVSPHVLEGKVILVGAEKWKDSLHFSRQISILDLKTGKVSGSVHYGEVERIEVNEADRHLLEEL